MLIAYCNIIRKIRKLPERLLILHILILFISFDLNGQSNRETGWFPVYNFSPKTYNATPQNWAVIQDHRGIMYFANTQGVLEYDGVNWQLILIPSAQNARSLTMDKNGRIYVGSVNEFGYLAPDSAGTMQFVSLRDHLPEDPPEFDDVWSCYAIEDRVFFQTHQCIFIWTGDDIKVVESASNIHEAFCIGDRLYAHIESIGLTRLDDENLNTMPGGDFFADKFIYDIVEISPDQWLIVTANSKLYLFNPSGDSSSGVQLTEFHSKAAEYFSIYEIYDALHLSNNTISFGTWGGGAVIVNTDGDIIQIFDKGNGIRDQIIQAQYMDENGNLWLGLSDGISRVEISSPLTFYTDQSGLTGIIQSITRSNDRLYIATNTGLFYLVNESPDPSLSDFTRPSFTIIEKLAMECWNLLTFENQGEELLLVATSFDITEVDENQRTNLILETSPYSLYQSRKDPARVFVGVYDGLISLYRRNNRWLNEGYIEGINETVSTLIEDDSGNLWMGTEEEGTLKLSIQSVEDNLIDKVTVTRYDTTSGLPEGHSVVFQTGDRILTGTSRGLYRYIPEEDIFIPDTTYGLQFSDGSHYIHRISEFDQNKIFLVAIAETEAQKFHIGYLNTVSDGSFEWITTPFTKTAEGIIHAIYSEEDRITWLGGPEGLYRFDAGIEKNYLFDFNTYIRNITESDGNLVFGGTYFNNEGLSILIQQPELRPVLPYSRNSLIFNFAAQPGEDERFNKYSYMLDGQDKSWSEWTSQTFKEYTNLWEGTYHFRVRSKNIYGHPGEEAVYSFTVQAPWYRTIGAYIAYVLLAGGFVYLIVTIYTRHLRAIIRERTAEVVRQKEEIEEKNREITDSIHYASRIQSAILPPGDYIRELLPDRFILYLPRDIVSGDFYWITKSNGKIITVASDCTGHGVPGAFMSMLGVAFLNEIVSKHTEIHANAILNELRSHVITSLRQTGKEGESKDGMDIALCIIDMENMQLEFSGANNPLLLIRNGELQVFKADKMPIGIHHRANEPFNLYTMDLQKGDILYTHSDGYVDQFGGPEGKKFMSKKFKELLLQIHKKDMQEQKSILENTLLDWMKNTEQVDDILVMGVRI